MDYSRIYFILLFAVLFALGTGYYQKMRKGVSFWKTFFTALFGYIGIFFMIAKFYYSLTE